MHTPALVKKSLRVSGYSFLFGTGLVVWFFCSRDWLPVALVSAAALLVVGLYNLYWLLLVLRQGLWEPENRRNLLTTGALMCLNIPAALLYAKFIGLLLNTLVVRLVNETDQPLTHVVVLGCGARPVADLQPGQATVLWLPITQNCLERSVLVQYAAGGATKQEVIDGYVVGGQRINHQLGRDEQVVARTSAP